MATLAELLRDRAVVPGPVVEHLQRLVGSWAILSDLSFSDLLLFVPTAGEQRGLCGGRPGEADHQPDASSGGPARPGGERQERPLLARAWSLGSVVEGEVPVEARNERARVVCIPVRFGGEVVAVLTREAPLVVGRRAGELERVYVGRVRPLRPDGNSGDVPLPRGRAAIERGATGRRRGDDPGCRRPGRVRLSQCRQRHAPAGGLSRHPRRQPRRVGGEG